MIPEAIKPVIDDSVKALCILPYYNHPKGCPNWNKKFGCPPNTGRLYEIIDMNRTIYCIYNRFDYLNHVERMRGKHLTWTYHQLRCCLYWQGKARKELNAKIKLFLEYFPRYYILTCPEAYGVNITETMKQIGIELEWPPVRYSYQVAIAGKLINPKA